LLSQGGVGPADVLGPRQQRRYLGREGASPTWLGGGGRGKALQRRPSTTIVFAATRRGSSGKKKKGMLLREFRMGMVQKEKGSWKGPFLGRDFSLEEKVKKESRKRSLLLEPYACECPG